jgi:hypothetical protein
MEWYVEKHNLINPVQSGFRKQRSTLDQIARLQDDAFKSTSCGQHTLAVFLDFSRAFDMVWRDGLLHKLHKLGVGGNVLNYVQDFLTDRSIRVKVGDALSDKYRMENGTPQGSVISPLLFNVMINDIPKPVDPATNTSVFADDSAAWKSGSNVRLLARHIQQHLDNVQRWADTWGFKLSETKSIAVLFTRSKTPATEVKLSINKQRIAVENQAKFLGIIFDRELSWRPHISQVVDKCKKVVNLMRSLSGETWGASKQSLLTIYRTLVRSRIDYGCEVYYTAAES